MADKLVQRIPVKAFLELSLDGKSASIIFEDEGGGQYLLQYQELGEYSRNLDVLELKESLLTSQKNPLQDSNNK